MRNGRQPARILAHVGCRLGSDIACTKQVWEQSACKMISSAVLAHPLQPVAVSLADMQHCSVGGGTAYENWIAVKPPAMGGCIGTSQQVPSPAWQVVSASCSSVVTAASLAGSLHVLQHWASKCECMSLWVQLLTTSWISVTLLLCSPLCAQSTRAAVHLPLLGTRAARAVTLYTITRLRAACPENDHTLHSVLQGAQSCALRTCQAVLAICEHAAWPCAATESLQARLEAQHARCGIGHV